MSRFYDKIVSITIKANNESQYRANKLYKKIKEDIKYCAKEGKNHNFISSVDMYWHDEFYPTVCIPGAMKRLEDEGFKIYYDLEHKRYIIGWHDYEYKEC